MFRADSMCTHTHTLNPQCSALANNQAQSGGGWLSLRRPAGKPLKLPQCGPKVRLSWWTWSPHASAVIDSEAAGTCIGREREMLAIFVVLVPRFNLCLDQHLA